MQTASGRPLAKEGTVPPEPVEETPEPDAAAADWRLAGSLAVAEFRARCDRDPTLLDWGTELTWGEIAPGLTVFAPPADGDALPYLDGSLDLVVLPVDNPERFAEARRAAVAVGVLGGGPGRHRPLAWQWAKTGAAPLPAATILIPTYNTVDLLDACLASLEMTLPSTFNGEILVADDGSTDGTADLLAEIATEDPRVRPLVGPNLGFLENCNRAAAAARGDYLVFLNVDTIALPGWLPPLLRAFARWPDAGAVGGKLLFADGRLQEAGAVVFDDGSAANVGRYGEPTDPRFSFPREVDYCSAALLATPRALFREIGGFDPRYKPAYYEDPDYCFEVRQRGRRVLYQPASAVVHLDAGAHGTEQRQAQLERNAAVFAEKWRDVLPAQPPRPERFRDDVWLPLVLRGLLAGGPPDGTGAAGASTSA